MTLDARGGVPRMNRMSTGQDQHALWAKAIEHIMSQRKRPG
jgi:hypothetical protein